MQRPIFVAHSPSRWSLWHSLRFTHGPRGASSQASRPPPRHGRPYATVGAPPPPHSAHQPLIATVVESALRSLPPVASYDPAVVPALVDALLADAAALLTDARAYASHAGRADLAAEDVRLAVDGCARGGAGGVGATPGGTTPDGAPLPGAGGGVHPLDLAALARVVNATPLPLCLAAVELVSSVVAVVASMQRCVDVTVVALATGATARPVATNFDLAGPPRCQWAL